MLELYQKWGADPGRHGWSPRSSLPQRDDTHTPWKASKLSGYDVKCVTVGFPGVSFSRHSHLSGQRQTYWGARSTHATSGARMALTPPDHQQHTSHRFYVFGQKTSWQPLKGMRLPKPMLSVARLYTKQY